MALSLYSTTTSHTNGSSVTISADIGSGTDRLCVVLVSCTWQQVTGVTVGGSAATQQVSRLLSGFHSYIYTKVAPSTGSQNVVVSLDGACNTVITVLVFTGADQTTPVRGTNYAEGTGTGPSLSISSSSTDTVVDCLTWNGDSASATASAGSGQTELHNYRYPSAYCAGAHSREAGASSVTMSWTLSASRDYSLVAASIQASPATTEALEGGVSGAATQSASMKNTRRVTASPSSGTSLSQVMSLYRRSAGAVSGSVTVAQSLRVGRKIAGTVSVAAAGSRALRVRWALGGGVITVSGGTRTVSLYRRMLAAVNVTSTGNRILSIGRQLNAVVAAASSGSRQLQVARKIAGAVAGAGSGIRTLSLLRCLAGATGSVSSGLRTLRLLLPLQGVLSAASSGSRALSVLRRMAASASAVFTQESRLMLYLRLLSALEVVSSSVGMMGQKVMLAMGVLGSSAVSAVAVRYRTMAGMVEGIVDASTALSVLRRLVSMTAGVTAAVGEFTRRVSMVGSAEAVGVLSAGLLALWSALSGALSDVASLGSALTVTLAQNVVAIAGFVVSLSASIVAPGVRRALSGMSDEVAGLLSRLTSFFRGSGETNRRVTARVALSGCASGRSITAHGHTIRISGRGRMVRAWR